MLRTITFTNERGTHVLADGRKNSKLCTFYEHRPGGIVQVVPRPRAEVPDVYWRKNTLTVIRFVVRREFSQGSGLHQFAHLHFKDVNGKGTFTSGVLGSTSLNVVGTNWVVEVVGMDDGQAARALIITYEARGGELK